MKQTFLSQSAGRWVVPRLVMPVLLVAVVLGWGGTGLAAVPSITLHDMMIGPVGSQAMFKATLLGAMDARETTPLIGTDELLERMVMVQYTVLPADRLTRQPRLAVRAVALDPRTETPLPGHVWEVTYGIRGDQPMWLGGDDMPADYMFLVEPGWLVDWSLTAKDARTEAPLEVGAAWAAAGTLPTFGLFRFHGDLALTGSLVEWVDIDGMGPVAHIAESGVGSGSLPIPTLAPFGTFTAPQVTIEQHYYAVPGQFPLRVEKHGNAHIRVEGLSASELRAGLPSDLDLAVRFSVVYDGDASVSLDIPPTTW